jgi:hypothetical protein
VTVAESHRDSSSQAAFIATTQQGSYTTLVSRAALTKFVDSAWRDPSFRWRRPSSRRCDSDEGRGLEANGAPPTGYQTVTLAQGAAGRLKYRMPVPKDFVPVKLLVDPSSLLGGPFRITLAPAAHPK